MVTLVTLYPVAQWWTGGRTCLLWLCHYIVGVWANGCGVQTPPALHTLTCQAFSSLWEMCCSGQKSLQGWDKSVRSPASDQTFHSFSCLEQNSNLEVCENFLQVAKWCCRAWEEDRPSSLLQILKHKINHVTFQIFFSNVENSYKIYIDTDYSEEI